MAADDRVFYKNWTPARKKKFVEFRLSGMHPQWAVFWTMIDRANSKKNILKEKQVMDFLASDVWYQRCWSVKMDAYEAKENMPPKELFDQLEKDTCP